MDQREFMKIAGQLLAAGASIYGLNLLMGRRGAGWDAIEETLGQVEPNHPMARLVRQRAQEACRHRGEQARRASITSGQLRRRHQNPRWGRFRHLSQETTPQQPPRDPRVVDAEFTIIDEEDPR